MNKIKYLFVCFLSFSMLASSIQPAFSQEKEAKSKKSKTQKADELFNRVQYSSAMEQYKKKYVKLSSNADKGIAAYKIGECYRMMSDPKNAADWYDKAGKAGNKDPELLLHWADALKMTGKYAEAIAKYNEYKTAKPDDPRGDQGVTSSQMAQEWKDKPTRFTVENVGALNTKYFDFATSKYPNDTNKLFLTSSREESGGTNNDAWYGQKFYDLFTASRDNNGKWSIPVPVPAPVNSDASDGAATLDSKGTTMYFTRCQSVDKKNGFCKIFKSTLGGSTWGAPEALPFNSDEYNTGQPSISADGSTLYFSSDMSSGQGGKDIYMSKWDAATNAWGSPVNLGTSINTSGDEMFPYINDNGKLYFSSNGLPGMGGWDIFSTTSDGGAWGNVTNLKSPINSPGDDFGVMFNSPTTGFFSSNREGGLGSDDIYSFIMPPPNFSVGGRVYDTDTKENISGATVELFGSDGTSLSVKTEANGTYKYMLKPGVKYKVSASYTGYLTKFAEVSTVGIDESKDFEANFDFPLKSTAKPITLPEIYYDLDKATLRAESKKALDGLILTLNENPTITVKIIANTDFRASDDYNLSLSDRRAKSVSDYLATHGVDKERLSSEGRGEKSPKEVENDEEYKPFKTGDKLTEEFINGLKAKADKEKAHQYNRRTEFEVLRTDYVPKQ
ncbi:MAG: OmpA family protein [Bacteroidia bacterium]